MELPPVSPLSTLCLKQSCHGPGWCARRRKDASSCARGLSVCTMCSAGSISHVYTGDDDSRVFPCVTDCMWCQLVSHDVRVLCQHNTLLPVQSGAHKECIIHVPGQSYVLGGRDVALWVCRDALRPAWLRARSNFEYSCRKAQSVNHRWGVQWG